MNTGSQQTRDEIQRVLEQVAMYAADTDHTPQLDSYIDRIYALFDVDRFERQLVTTVFEGYVETVSDVPLEEAKTKVKRMLDYVRSTLVAEALEKNRQPQPIPIDTQPSSSAWCG